MKRFDRLQMAAGGLGVLLAASISVSAHAAAALDKPLQPLGFLVGEWEGGGPVPETGGRAHGFSTITAQADGHVLVRSDRNDAFDGAGRLSHSFAQFMSIYADKGGVYADYIDGDGHVIHYGPATVIDGKAVEFISVAASGAPTFRLRYDADGSNGLKIWFGSRPPGKATFAPIAFGEIYRVK